MELCVASRMGRSGGRYRAHLETANRSSTTVPTDSEKMRASYALASHSPLMGSSSHLGSLGHRLTRTSHRFSYKRTAISSSHSTGALSFCSADLDYDEKYDASFVFALYLLLISSQCSRYNVRNLVMESLTPGPHELTAEQKQHFIRDHVIDLLQLYDDGIVIRNPQFPQGKEYTMAR